VLFTFPSRYSFTIGHLGVFSLSGWCRLDSRQGFTGLALLRIPALDHIYVTPTGLSPSMVPLSRRSSISVNDLIITQVLQPRKCRNTYGLGSSPFARHYLGNHYCFLSPAGYLDVSVLRVRLPNKFGITAEAAGLPHSDISGSQTACVYPKLFAACHVLLRLQMPRHPPCILLFFLPKLEVKKISLFTRYCAFLPSCQISS
jgi:hypothetical protein